jgi:hypothetical protein
VEWGKNKMSAKVWGLGIGAGLLGLGLTGNLSRFLPSSKKTVADQVKEGAPEMNDQRWHFLEPAAELALKNDHQLEDFVDRLYAYSKYDEDLWEEFVRGAASTAEFLLRKQEIEFQRGIPLLFKKHSQTMFTRLREIRRVIRDTQPSELEEFDEIVAELGIFQSDTHHNLWCEAHSA